MLFPENINKGDVLAIISPAKAIEEEYVMFAKNYWEKAGYKVVLGENCLGRDNYFSGTEQERISDLNWALNHKEVKAVLCARGGYGCVHSVEHINWEQFKNNPKWLVGFSDVTVFHCLFSTLGVASIHGTMPLNYKENTARSLLELERVLLGEKQIYSWISETYTSGKTSGNLIGGNFAVISDLIGTRLQPDFTAKILFLEEVGEYHYTIDRMMYQLKLSGILESINGLIIGGFSKTGDSSPPFGKNVREILSGHLKDLAIPVAFDFPVGHQNDNLPLKCGGFFNFEVNKGEAKLVEISS